MTAANDRDPATSVGDPATHCSRRSTSQCLTCVFRPGDLMHLGAGKLKELVDTALAKQSFVVCHETLPGVAPTGVLPAICRGFADRYTTNSLRIIERLFGFVDQDPPAVNPFAAPDPDGSPQPAPAPQPTPLARAAAHRPPAAIPSPRRVEPIVYVDVDGVLNPDRPHLPGYAPYAFDGPGPDGDPTKGWVWLNPSHGEWLAELATAGATLAWSTSWRHLANEWIAPLLGLPGDWPTLPITSSGITFGWSDKIHEIDAHADGRPLAMLDDVVGPRDPEWARLRTANTAPTLLVPVDPTTGLTRTHIDTVLAWLSTLT